MSLPIACVVNHIWLAEDQRAIKFGLNDGQEIIARCDGECCSNTWIEDLINPELALGSPITATGDLDLHKELMGPTKTGNGEDVVRYYGFFIETSKGRCVIAYRNSSNGYYGGSLVWPDEDYYGGVYGQNVTNGKWKEIV